MLLQIQDNKKLLQIQHFKKATSNTGFQKATSNTGLQKATSNTGLQKAKIFLAFSRTLCYYIQALCNYVSNGTIKAAYDRSEHHEGRHPSQL